MRISDWSSDVCSSDLANPGQQGMALHDIIFCRPTTNLAIAKTSGIVSDPVNGTTNAKAIPGARMRYCILVTNNRSEEHTSELQSLMRISYAVFCLKKKNNTNHEIKTVYET